MIENVLLLSGSVVAAVELCKTTLSQLSFFQALDEQAQSLVLQVLAFVFGVVAALSGSVNVFVGLPAFAAMPEWLGVVVTGLIAGTGSAGIHVILSLLGVRVGVTAESVHRVDTKAQAANRTTSTTYSPFS